VLLKVSPVGEKFMQQGGGVSFLSCGGIRWIFQKEGFENFLEMDEKILAIGGILW
jgi:hypothetical protein